MALALLSFDLDGTLVDTAGEIAEAANRTLADWGLPTQPPAALALLIGHGAHALMSRLLAQLGMALPPDDEAVLLQRFDRHYADTTATTGQPYPGAARALAQLRAHGVATACVTNKEERHTRRLLDSHGLTGAFNLIVGGDTLAERKPHPLVLSHVAQALGVPRQSMARRMAHLGDSAVDVQAARAAGVLAWAVPYGYNSGRPVAEAGPDALFATLGEAAEAALRLTP